MTSVKRNQIRSSLSDKEYRELFVASTITNSLAFQIRAMREDRGWTQGELGRLTGMAQETISLLENPNYGKFTLRTLKRLASAYDVALVVRFAPFGQLIDWVAELEAEDLTVPDFDEEMNRRGADGSARTEAHTPFYAPIQDGTGYIDQRIKTNNIAVLDLYRQRIGPSAVQSWQETVTTGGEATYYGRAQG